MTVGDWRMSFTVTTSTDDSQDTPRSKELARMRELDEREAQRLGERTPNPLLDLLQLRRDRPLGRGFLVASMAHGKLQPAQQRQSAVLAAIAAPLGHLIGTKRR